jgi:hypothetical protein
MGSAGDLIGSLNARERLLPMMRETGRRDPSFDNRGRLEGTLLNLGYSQARLTRFAEATAYETEALTLCRALAAERPGDAVVRRRLFNALYYLGLVEGAGDRPSLGRSQEAATRFEEALTEINVLQLEDRERRLL